MKNKLVIFTISLIILNPTVAEASDSQRIAQLEKRVAALESEVAHLRNQEARASKYLKCIQNVNGNYITIPIRIINCIRK